MTNEDILREISALPKLARREVEDFISFLSARYTPVTSNPNTSIANEEFIGMWRDRDEFVDSTAWVRDIRNKHWSN